MGLFETLKQRLRQHQNGKPYGEPVLGMLELKLRDFEPGGEGLLVPIQEGLLFFSKTDRHNVYTYKGEKVSVTPRQRKGWLSTSTDILITTSIESGLFTNVSGDVSTFCFHVKNRTV